MSDSITSVKELMTTAPKPAVCPCCGYCPTCGRSNAAPVPYPVYPAPYPAWPAPHYPWVTWISTADDVPLTGTITYAANGRLLQ